MSPEWYFISTSTYSDGAIPFSKLVALINSDPINFKFNPGHIYFYNLDKYFLVDLFYKE